MRSFTKHLSHYLVLFGILFAGLIGLVTFSYDKNFQQAVALATAASYFSWGIVHHYWHHDLQIEVVVEYLVVAIVGVALIFSLILV